MAPPSDMAAAIHRARSVVIDVANEYNAALESIRLRNGWFWIHIIVLVSAYFICVTLFRDPATVICLMPFVAYGPLFIFAYHRNVRSADFIYRHPWWAARLAVFRGSSAHWLPVECLDDPDCLERMCAKVMSKEPSDSLIVEGIDYLLAMCTAPIEAIVSDFRRLPAVSRVDVLVQLIRTEHMQ